MKPLKNNKFISSFIGLLALNLGIAGVTSFSGFSVYITSYIYLKDHQITMFYGVFISLIFSFAHTIGNALGGILENKIGFFKTIILGFIVTFYSNMGFIFQQNIWLCYGLTFIAGIGVGLSTSLLFKNLAFYSPEKKGFLISIVGIGGNIIGTFYSYGGEKLINFEGYTLTDNDNYYPSRIANRTYLYFFVTEFIMPIGLIIGLLFTYEYKQEYSKKVKSNSENDKKEEDEQKNESKKKYTMKKIKLVVKSFRYWRLVTMAFFISIGGSFIGSTYRTFGAIIGINGNALQAITLILTFFTVILMPILGCIVDKKGPLILIRISAFISIPPVFCLAFFMNNTPIFILCTIIYNLTAVGLGISFVPFIMNVYGIQESVILFPIMGAFTKISEILGIVLGFVLSLNDDKESLKSNYKIMYIISGC